MNLFYKLLITNAIILAAATVGKRYPSLGGLIATMPLTSLIVLLWLYSDGAVDHEALVRYTRGVVWGILPSIAFFLTALFCFQRRAPLLVALAASFAVWLAGAALHRWLLA